MERLPTSMGVKIEYRGFPFGGGKSNLGSLVFRLTRTSPYSSTPGTSCGVVPCGSMNELCLDRVGSLVDEVDADVAEGDLILPSLCSESVPVQVIDPSDTGFEAGMVSVAALIAACFTEEAMCVMRALFGTETVINEPIRITVRIATR